MAAINMFKIKEWFAFVLVGMVPTVVFAALLFFNGILWALVGWLVILLLMILIARRLIKNPFTDMLKGEGLLTLNIDSTGRISAFVSRLSQGVLNGFFDSSEVADSFDREGVAAINAPVKTKSSFRRNKEDNAYTLTITDKELYDSRFAFNQFPCLIYNNHTGTFVTKTQFSNLEKNLVAHNKLIYLTKQVESLNRNTLHFARHVIDQLKPKNNAFGGMPNWVSIMIIIAVFIIIGLVVFKGISAGGLGDALGSAKGAVGGIKPIQPMG